MAGFGFYMSFGVRVQEKYIKILRSLTLKVYTISRRVGAAIARSD
ncbi:hypothetical protein [Kamptonema sp. UHCC 0994]|nr:hypothetical protein [Kamptonema sp. UHCC 0994]MDF0552986.1 hypothetical protein [Kamptonema sp. UHCC 0994]